MNRKDSLKVNKLDKENNILLTLIAFVFTIGVYTIDTFVSSLNVQVLFIIVTTILLLVYYLVSKDRITLFLPEVMWFIFCIYFILNIGIHGRMMTLYIIDVLAFSFFVVFLVFYKVKVNYLYMQMKIMLFLSILYSFGSIFQYMNIELYMKYIVPNFNSAQIEELLMIYRRGNYTGVTWQTAFISGYLVFGIAIVLFLYKRVESKVKKSLLILSIPFMLYSLLLAGKRAHLIFMFAALTLTYLCSVNLKRIGGRVLKVVSAILLIIIGFMSIMNIYIPNPESQLGKVYLRLVGTLEGLNEGEDITSGRTFLYDYALQLFSENPFIGIGWRIYKEESIGVLSSYRGSHPHNIFLQVLAELGILGFILFIIPIAYVLVLTIKNLISVDKYYSNDLRWKIVLQYSLYLQFFFVFYGLTGNLLTDRLFLFMYLFAVSIILSALKYKNHIVKLERKN